MAKPTVFISHITEEKAIARAVKELIEKKFLKYINVFASSHEESIKLGDAWFDTIKQSIKDCHMLIVICSPISVIRPWINFEAGAGWIKGVPVIPLCHSGLTPGKLPVPLNSFQGGLINNPEDIKNLFNRIAAILEVEAPDSESDKFFSAIEKFEEVLINTSLVQDTNLIFNLLYRQIEMLKYSIFASTNDYLELNDITSFKFADYNIIFNKIHNLFNASLLMNYHQIEVFEVYHKTIQQMSDNIKFILTYKNLNISPKINYLLNNFLFTLAGVEDWYGGISLAAKHAEIKNPSINMINSEPLPPTRRNHSNVINHYIAYYETLQSHQRWIVEYHDEINSILKVEKS